MKKRKYLWHVFILLKAPIRMRRDVVRELSGLLSDKLEQGRTMEEAVAEIGSAREIAEVYKEIDAEKNYRYWVRMIICIVIAVLLGVMLYFDGSELVRGYSRIQAMMASNAFTFAVYDIDTDGVIIKIIFETLGCVICIVKCILYFIKTRKETKNI